MTEVIGVRFRGGCKEYYFDPHGIAVEAGQFVIVETAQGTEYAQCLTGNHEVDDGAVVRPLRALVRIATENDRRTMEENIEQFGLNNITIIDHVDDESMKELPIPSIAMLVASASMEQEIACLMRLNPHMEFVIYTLDFRCAAALPDLFAKLGIGETEVIQITVSRMNAKHNFTAEPAPWLITGRGGV